ILDGRLTAPDDPVAVGFELDGERVREVGRRGKYLLFGFDTGRVLAVHLRMTSWFHYRQPGPGPSQAGPGPSQAGPGPFEPVPGTVTAPVTHLRATFDLDDGAQLVYDDQRRFGTFRLIEPGGLDAYLRLRAGPEPLDAAWTPGVLRASIRNRRAPIKAVLLDQLVVAGVGNIYADEALWEARVHPLRPGAAVTSAQARRLHDAVVAVLERGIAYQGASIRDYRGVDGAAGSMQERFNVYGREGEPCPRCGRPIRKIWVAQRGTHFCSHCTRLPRL
ncbi:MAG: bifunctional DNA-formamidopyrimidine glycosylase/DNA-(apurinic or apyrimidinic site) lyase, partial [Gaiellales bacterium]